MLSPGHKLNEKTSEPYLKLEELIRKFNNEEMSAINCIREIANLFERKKIEGIVQRILGLQYLPKEKESRLLWVASWCDTYKAIKGQLDPIKQYIKAYNEGKLSEKELVRKIDESGISFEGRRISISTLVSALLVGGELKEEKGTKLRWAASYYDTYKAIKGKLDPIKKYVEDYNKGKLSEKKLIREIDKSQIFLEGRKISIETLVNALIVAGELKEERGTALGRIASCYDTYKDIIPYLSSHQIFYEIKDIIKKGTQEEMFNFCYAIEHEGILNYIKEKTKRNIGLITLIHALMVGDELPYKPQIMIIVGAYKKSKAKELEELYKEANNATHFAELVAENWDYLKGKLNMKEKPWSKVYCRAIYNAINFRKKHGYNIKTLFPSL